MRATRTPIVIICLLILSAGLVYAESPRDSFQYLQPVPGSKMVSKETSIMMRTSDYLTSGDINAYSQAIITGSESGNHGFEVIVAKDNLTAILKPFSEFSPGEVVTVNFSNAELYSFEISSKSHQLLTLEDWQTIYYGEGWQDSYNSSWSENDEIATDRDVSLPSDFPTIEVYVNNNPSPGYMICN